MRYKIVACILLILSVFSFVLPAPVPVQEVREVYADAMEGGENAIIVSGKRAPPGNPHQGEESDLYPPELSDTESGTSQPQSPSTPNYASGSHPGVDMPSSPPGGSKSPPGPKMWSTPEWTDVPLDEEGTFKPGTTTENQPASSSETKSVSWGHTTKVHFFHDEPDTLGLPRPPGREGYLAKAAGRPSSSLEIEHASPSSYFDPPPPPPPKPQSKGLVSNVKSYFGKLRKLKFRPRSKRTVDTGA